MARQRDLQRLKTYVAVAYRFGWLNGGHWLVGCWPSRAEATANANAFAIERAGKYGVVLYRVQGQEVEEVGYIPSGRGERTAYLNGRIELDEAVGYEIVEQVLARQPVSSAQARAIVESQVSVINRCLYPGAAAGLEPPKGARRRDAIRIVRAYG